MGRSEHAAVEDALGEEVMLPCWGMFLDRAEWADENHPTWGGLLRMLGCVFRSVREDCRRAVNDGVEHLMVVVVSDGWNKANFHSMDEWLHYWSFRYAMTQVHS